MPFAPLKQIARALRDWAKAWLAEPLDKRSHAEHHREEVHRLIERLRGEGMRIGERCYIWGSQLSAKDPVEIGNDCVLTGCAIIGHDATPALFVPELWNEDVLRRRSLFRPTVIRDRTFVGYGAIVLCGRTIGPNAIVAAGAVVTKDVPPGMVVAGNPARVIGTTEEFVKRHRGQIQKHPEWYSETWQRPS